MDLLAKKVNGTMVGDNLFYYVMKAPTGINIPVRIGSVRVMPGDLVVGDREGGYFIRPQLMQEVLDGADEIHIHDEWTKKKFDQGKYKSREICSTPCDPKLLEEYQEYLNKRSEEIRKQRSPK